MTLMAIDPSRIEPYAEHVSPGGPSAWCEVPGCGEGRGLERHHIVRRTATGGPVDWLLIDGHLVVRNTCMLCKRHHDDITGLIGGHRAAIRWVDGEGWTWYERAALRFSGSAEKFVKLKSGDLLRPVGLLK